MIEIRRILCPTDFSEYSAHALPYATEMAKKFGAKISLLHVVSLPAYVSGYEVSIDMTSMSEMMVESAKKRMVSEEAKIRAEGIEVDSYVPVGSPFMEIVEFARTRQIDLIIISTHGSGALKHLLMGSTAEKIVWKAPCPVLTVHHHEGDSAQLLV